MGPQELNVKDVEVLATVPKGGFSYQSGRHCLSENSVQQSTPTMNTETMNLLSNFNSIFASNLSNGQCTSPNYSNINTLFLIIFRSFENVRTRTKSIMKNTLFSSQLNKNTNSHISRPNMISKCPKSPIW